MNVAVIIPFRDRGKDPLRPANLRRVLMGMEGLYRIHVVDDGRSGYESFNRSAAYNRGADMVDADVLIYCESDLLVDPIQIREAVALASLTPGLVVPFSRFMAIAPEDSVRVRDLELEPEEAVSHQVRGDRQSIGAVNVVSRESLTDRSIRRVV